MRKAFLESRERFAGALHDSEAAFRVIMALALAFVLALTAGML